MSARKGIALLLSGLAAGCVADRPLPVTDDRSAPLALVRPMHCGNRVQYCQSQSPDGRLPMSTINDTLLRFIDGDHRAHDR
jgi:hypothetical protein